MSGGGLSVAMAGVDLSYGDRRVLHDIDVEIGAGERVCLVGPNGAGKTTLLRCVTGLVEPDGGRVSLDGRPLSAYDRTSLARRVAVVPGQVDLPFSMRAEEVVLLGRIPYERTLVGADEGDHAAALAAMVRVGIGHLVGRDARELSMGERQLVLIAMALAQSGRLLVLDEPTVHLDLRHQVEVLSLLSRLTTEDGLTVLAVLHDLPLAAAFFERIVLIDDGRIVADGEPADVLTPERIEAVYGVDPRFVPTLARAAGGPPADGGSVAPG